MPPSCLIRDHDITALSAFHTPAKARYYFEILDQSALEHLREIYEFSIHEHLPIIFIARGTNFLFAFDVFPGIIIRFDIRGYTLDGWILTVQAWELVSLTSQKIYTEHKNSHLIPWVWLPGTWGGAIAGNAGCFGLEAKDFLLDVAIYDMARWTHETWTREQCLFAYRTSKLKAQSQRLILSARFDLGAIVENPYMEMSLAEFMSVRREKQPAGHTCGSFFKNPPWESAGRLIDAVGLKWTRIGWAKISEVHANFFMNDEHGTFQDILALRDLSKKTIQESYKITLEEEVRIISVK